ncbi:MAG TPA: sulfatase-like hydrolase/transferase [Thermoanaerobaculia bacterium]|nr:sulfatase-like hydrolase/transferase [Thermoanaerobaculia bacterium]
MFRTLPQLTSLVLAVALVSSGCSRSTESRIDDAPTDRPSILLITLDTTRADSIGPDAKDIKTPAFNALAGRGMRFRQAYASVPETLPSHSTIMTGVYPAMHGVHENARTLAATHPLLAEKLRDAGYQTAAFISAYPLDRRYGLARGFGVYEDQMPEGRSERTAKETTDLAIAHLEKTSPDRPLFLWVHYFDPHYPYEPPEPFRSRYAERPYAGEVASMDQEMGRLLEAFRQHQANGAIVVTADHGESLGEHGEAQHGNLVYQGAMHVPLVIAGPGIAAGTHDRPVSNRRIFHTVLDLAGLGNESSLRNDEDEVVVGEAMKPFLNFGWQPQMMAIDGRLKAIRAGTIEVYDVIADYGETRDLTADAELSRGVRQALRDYPVPSLEVQPTAQNISDEERKRLASLGYVGSDARPVVRPDAPSPRDMAHLFDDLDRASGLFVAGEYRQAIPILERILATDEHNLMTALRLAAAHSALGANDRALEAFRRAESIAPASGDVRHYLALHYMRTGEWERAIPLLEKVLAETPDRLPAIEALAEGRERQGRVEEALRLRQRALTMKTATPEELLRVGQLAMASGNTPVALEAFEKARLALGDAFRHDLELGVLYLDARRLEDARNSLDRVSASHPSYPMALFKRAQVSALLREPDVAARIEAARRNADATTRTLIERERLFQ